MQNPDYIRALNRSDLSQWVVHFVRPSVLLSITPFKLGNSADILNSIFNEFFIRPSKHEYVTRYCPDGSACFYDAPPNVWPEIVNTNPNKRAAVGIICHKNTIWALGGRPVIYTDPSGPDYWPERERFRIVNNNLARQPQPNDWTHEREWRVRGGLSLTQPTIPYTWWWPIVPNLDWMNYLFATYSNISQIYVISENKTLTRSAQGHTVG